MIWQESKNKRGNRASPAVRHALKNVEKLPEAEKKRIAPALRRSMVVENIAAQFVSSGNSQDLIQELSKLTDMEPVGQEPSTPQKKGKTTSSPRRMDKLPVQ